MNREATSNPSPPSEKKELKDKIMLFPIGVTKSRSFDSRGPWILNNPEEVIRQSISDGDLPIDYEHQSSYCQHNGKPAPAAGWIVKMYVGSRDDLRKLNGGYDEKTPQTAILAEVVWTKKAHEMIKNGEYRFISPSFLTNDKQEVSQIIGASLVNLPAITTLPPLLVNSSHKLDNIAKISGNIKKYLFQRNEKTETSKLAIALPNIAKSESDQEKNSPTMTPEKPSVLTTKIESLSCDESASALVDSLIEEALAQGKIIPAQKQYAEICAQTAPQAFVNFLTVAPPLAYRQQTVSSSQTENTVLSSVEEEIINALGVDPQLFHKLKN